MKPLLLYVVLLCFSPLLMASQHAEQGWSFALSAGKGAIQTPLSFRDDVEGNLLPSVSYYGERFYLENSFLGYSLLETEDFYLDVVGQLNDDGYFFVLDGINKFGWWDALGMTRFDGPVYSPGYFDPIKRHLSYMTGLSATWITSLMNIRSQWLKDISAGHHGAELHLALHRDFVWQSFTLRLNGGWIYKDADLHNYYYNVRQHELGNKPSDFYLSSGWSQHYGLTLSYSLNDEWALQWHWQKTNLPHSLDPSPLLRRLNYKTQFVGVRYQF